MLYTVVYLFIQDLSGRPHLGYDLQIPTQRVGTYDTQVKFFFGYLLLQFRLYSTHGTDLYFTSVVGRAFFPIFGEYFRNDTSYPAGN